MSESGPIVPDIDDRDDASEIEARRMRVLRLRCRRQTEKQIAVALSVSEPTVSRDLKWIRQHWQSLYGQHPSIDPAEVVGEALFMYQECEQRALNDYDACKRVTDEGAAVDMVFFAKQRAACLLVVLKARECQIALLQDLGVVDRAIGRIDIGLPTATQIRAALDQAKALPDEFELPERQPDTRPS